MTRIERELDDNEQAQRRCQREQDGSEIRSVELERLTAEGMTLIERRNTMEFFRDQAAEHFERHTGSHWRPRTGSMVNHRTLTAAMIDSRDFLAAKRRAETEVLLPAGPKIAFTGGLDFNDHRLIWDKLDQVRAKHPDMVLLHGGSPKGAERIAARWADHRKVPQIAFKPDWAKHAKAAPFKRNDAMLEVLPIGVMVFPGTGIQDNLADKARKLGIPVWKLATAARERHRPFACDEQAATEPIRRSCWHAISAIPRSRRGGGGRRNPCHYCHGSIHHARTRHPSQHRRSRLLLLGAVHARDLCAAVLRRHDRWPLRTRAQALDRLARSFSAYLRLHSHLSSAQTIFSLVRTPILRIAVALMFAVPAALAGYYATYGLSGLTITSVPWRQVFAVIGAVVIGVTAWARLAASPPGGSGAPGRPAMS